jgi:hypothetical protein
MLFTVIQKGVGYVLTMAMAVVLVGAWILTEPLFEWLVYWGEVYRKWIGHRQESSMVHANRKVLPVANAKDKQ